MSTVPFLNRRIELETLEKEYAKEGFSLIIVYGRRGIGKTRLLMEWSKHKRGVYYIAAQLSYEQLAQEFSDLVGLELGIWVPRDIVEAITKIAELGKKTVVVLDEFQYIVEADPSITSRLQRAIDRVLANTNIKLVLSGSAISFFEKELLGYRSPIFGRRTLTLRLKQIKITHAREFLSKMSTVEAIRTYAILGGSPSYLKIAYGKKSTRHVLEEILSPGHRLLNEAEELLRQELREPKTYMAILKAVAEGKTRPSELAQTAMVDVRTIHHYVNVLRELEILDTVKPLGQKRGSRLRFTDNYFYFWFHWIVKLRSLVEAGLTDKAINIVLDRIDEYTAKTIEYTIETIIPELYEHNYVKTKPVEVGPWWKGREEIDLIVRDPGKTTTFIEVKWADTSLREAEKTLNKLVDKASRTGLTSPQNHYMLITRSMREHEKVDKIELDDNKTIICLPEALEKIWSRIQGSRTRTLTSY